MHSRVDLLNLATRSGRPPKSRRPGQERILRVPQLRWGVDSAAVPIIASVWLMGCLLAIVMLTPYSGDDVINKNIRENVHAAGKTLPGFMNDQIVWWMTHEGRFFPGSVVWTESVFWVFGSRVAYKLVIGLVLIGAIAGFGLFVSRLTGSLKAGTVYGTIVFGLIQLRTPYDGVISFAGLLPLTAGLSIATMVILISRRGIGWTTLAALSYSLALVTYETVFLFAPIMVAIVVWARRTWRPALAIAIPAFVQLGIVVILRLWLRAPTAPGYTMNIEPKAILFTFSKQVLAAFPLSQWAFSVDAVPTITAGAIAAGVLAAGVPTFLALAFLGRSQILANRTEAIVIGVFGAWIWLSSSALISITRRWQVDLHLGQGYLSVVYGYFGLALCLLSAYLLVDRIVANRPPRSMAIWRYSSALLIGVTASLTLAGNMSIFR